MGYHLTLAPLGCTVLARKASATTMAEPGRQGRTARHAARVWPRAHGKAAGE